MVRRAAVLLVLMLGASSCGAGAGAQNGQAPPPEYAVAQAGADVIQTTIDGSRIFGPTIMLERSSDGLRGKGPTGVVDLRTDDDTLRGFVGSGPTELHLESLDAGGFELRGMFSGALSHLEVRSDGIAGQLGHCQYNLRRYPSELGAAYNGQRICKVATSFEPATLTLAPTIAALEPIDRAAIITILLGR